MKQLRQTDASYLNTLKELVRRVRAGVVLRFEETASNVECTLGLCADDIQDMQDGEYGKSHHACPNDRRFFTTSGKPTKQEGINQLGCFDHCRIFHPKAEDTLTSLRPRIKKVFYHQQKELTKYDR